MPLFDGGRSCIPLITYTKTYIFIDFYDPAVYLLLNRNNQNVVYRPTLFRFLGGIFSMLVFDKDHYSLIELADRWRLPFKDIAYHAEREHLEVQIWLGEVPAMRYVFKKAANGEKFPVQKDITTLKGYFIVSGDELRTIFRMPGIPEIRKFYSLDRKEVYSFYPFQESLQINLVALEVTRAERDRFETSKNIRPFIMPENKTESISKSVGRPSHMDVVVQHFDEREMMGHLAPTLAAECLYLETWGKNKLGEDAPAAGTIGNNIRSKFNAWKASRPHSQSRV